MYALPSDLLKLQVHHNSQPVSFSQPILTLTYSVAINIDRKFLPIHYDSALVRSRSAEHFVVLDVNTDLQLEIALHSHNQFVIG
jgi:hypothetical protein